MLLELRGLLNSTAVTAVEANSPTNDPIKIVPSQEVSEDPNVAELNEATSDVAVPESPYLKAVREFADNVLKYGRDTYGPKHTPLFVDGLNIHTHEPVKWINLKGPLSKTTETEEWILSHFSSQQTLLRTLDGLSTLTGDQKYRDAAMETIEYVFENLRFKNGLLIWGTTSAYDALNDSRCGSGNHGLKYEYPYYELMWEVNPKITEDLIGKMWSAHVVDWSTLELDRQLQNTSRPLKKPWDYEYRGGPVFAKPKKRWGFSVIPTASSLIQGGAILHRLTGQQQPLIWSKRVGSRFIETRHPNTGISSLNNYGIWREPLIEEVKGKSRDVRTALFPWDVHHHAFLRDFPENMIVHPWISFFLTGEILEEDGKVFTQWALEELTAWGKHSYRKKDNCFVPMLTDGTSLEGYVWKNGPGQSTGCNEIKLYPVEMQSFWGYSLAYAKTGDRFMWKMARDIAYGHEFGDIGLLPNSIPALNIKSSCSHPYAIFGFLELYKSTRQQLYLRMACRIADNILEERFCNGFFVPAKKHFYTKLDRFEPLALLRLVATIKDEPDMVPQPWPGMPMFIGVQKFGYRYKLCLADHRLIYELTESSELPLSIEEAAAIGDLDLIKRLIEEGVKVEAFDRLSYMTPLHRAAMEGQKSAVELLLTEGAPVNERDFALYTPLTYAVKNSHKDIVSLLISKGADVNYDRGGGGSLGPKEYSAPLDIAVQNDDKEIIKLLSDAGAELRILHAAVQIGDQSKIKALLDQGSKINERDIKGLTPLDYAVRGNKIEIIKILINGGADVNAADFNGLTPLQHAVRRGSRDIVELLLNNGADPNRKNRLGSTPFFEAIRWGKKEIVDVFIQKGVDISTIHRAAAVGDMEKIDNFLRRGVSVNVKDDFGWGTPLFWASCMNQAETVKFLVDHGADVNARADNQSVPLHNAAWLGAFEALQVLLSSGADVNAKNKWGHTPLDLAKRWGLTKVVEILTKAAEEQKKAEEENQKDKEQPEEDKQTTEGESSSEAPDMRSTGSQEHMSTSGEGSRYLILDTRYSNQDGSPDMNTDMPVAPMQPEILPPFFNLPFTNLLADDKLMKILWLRRLQGLPLPWLVGPLA